MITGILLVWDMRFEFGEFVEFDKFIEFIEFIEFGEFIEFIEFIEFGEFGEFTPPDSPVIFPDFDRLFLKQCKLICSENK